MKFKPKSILKPKGLWGKAFGKKFSGQLEIQFKLKVNTVHLLERTRNRDH